MEITKYTVEIELVEPLLGTVPKNKEIYKQFIAAKAVELGLADEEVATVKDVEEKGWTGFHEDEEGPFLYNYAIKGFLCEAARTIKQWGLMKQLQDKVKRHVFVRPRRVRLPKPPAEGFPVLERPLRAQTPQGPRTALSRSDMVPAGTRLKFTLSVLDSSGITEKCLRDIFPYGELMGLGQWRSGGYGGFTLVSLEEV